MTLDLARSGTAWRAEPGWLNTATYGLPPDAAWDEMQEALAAWRVGRHSWEPWNASIDRARAAFARLVGVDPGRVAAAGAVSELVGLVAAALPPGSRVVAPEGDFTSILFPWLVQADRGVEVVTVPLQRLAESVTPGTTVVAFSAVQSATGELAATDDVLAAAAAVDALTVVDGTQAVGWLPLDAGRVDAVACAAYKWLMSPRGTAFMTVSERLAERLRPHSAGWYAGPDVFATYYGTPLRLAEDASRFDVSPAWFCWVGTAPTLEALERLTVEAVHEHDVGLANRFRAGLDLPPGDSAIVSVQVDGAQERLERAGIRAATRAGGLRASFHLYTTEADVDTALDALR
jgi:selenocysteine lyase/cysteine desulfurase